MITYMVNYLLHHSAFQENQVLNLLNMIFDILQKSALSVNFKHFKTKQSSQSF